MAKRKSRITAEMQHTAERELKEQQNQIDYDTKDFTVELIVNKFNENEFFIPEYQRQYVWKDKNKSLFIESLLLGLPIPFMFCGDCPDGKMEIIDGAQRIQTLVNFLQNKIKLKDLKKLPSLNKFFFDDLPDSQKKKFLNRALRIIILAEGTPNDIRQDLFNRINTTGSKAKDAEIRRGSYPGPLTSFVETCAKNELFIQLCPISKTKVIRHERFELILRFFAYLNNYERFVHAVNTFLDDFLIQNLDDFDQEQYEHDFTSMLDFVGRNFPNGFKKNPTSGDTPRVRFEAISVGVALALRETPELVIDNVDWLSSPEFDKLTTSDASNNRSKLVGRIEYVKEKLLEDSK